MPVCELFMFQKHYKFVRLKHLWLLRNIIFWYNNKHCSSCYKLQTKPNRKIDRVNTSNLQILPFALLLNGVLLSTCIHTNLINNMNTSKSARNVLRNNPTNNTYHYWNKGNGLIILSLPSFDECLIDRLYFGLLYNVPWWYPMIASKWRNEVSPKVKMALWLKKDYLIIGQIPIRQNTLMIPWYM